MYDESNIIVRCLYIFYVKMIFHCMLSIVMLCCVIDYIVCMMFYYAFMHCNTVLRCDMLWNVTLCRLSCYVMLCIMLRYVTTRYLRYVMLCNVVTCHVVSCSMLWYEMCMYG